MKTVKKTAEYTIFERRDGRYAVKNAAKKWVNGDDKIAVLKKEKLLKAPKAKPKPKAEPEPEQTEQAEVQAEEQAATDAEAEKSAADGEATGE